MRDLEHLVELVWWPRPVAFSRRSFEVGAARAGEPKGHGQHVECAARGLQGQTETLAQQSEHHELGAVGIALEERAMTEFKRTTQAVDERLDQDI